MTFRNGLLIILLVVTVFGGAAKSGDPNWQAGKAKAKITPEKFMWMSGYGSRNKPADGKLTDLWAKVLVLKDANGSISCLITLDLIGIGRKMSQEICSAIAERHGVRRDQIAICTSHTHTGPALADNLMPLHFLVVDREQQELIEQYSGQLKKAVVETVGKALQALKPATLSWGSGHATFAVNRRNNPEAQVPKLRQDNQLKGPFDHDVPVLAVRSIDGKLESILFGYACHATVLSFYQWSGDYPGYAQIELENSHVGCQAMFWAGCGGDQNPLPRRRVELAREYGKRLAAAVDEVLAQKMELLEPSCKTVYQEINLPLSEIPSRDQIEKDAESSNRFVKARAKFLLTQLGNHKALPSTYPYPVQTWQLGNRIQFVFLGGEVVVDFALRLKTEGQGTRTWVAAYANDVMAYIASRRVLREGGYEGGGAMVYYGLPAPWAKESEAMIIGEAMRQAQQLKK